MTVKPLLLCKDLLTYILIHKENKNRNYDPSFVRDLKCSYTMGD